MPSASVRANCWKALSHDHFSVTPLFEGWHFDPMPLYLAYPPNRYVSAKLRVFVDWVVDVVGETAPSEGAGARTAGQSVRPAE